MSPSDDTSRGNRFFSKISCMKLCQKVTLVEDCHMPPDPGTCSKATFQNRYFYSPSLGKCLSFNYSGCEGNNNNFQSFLSCQDSCSGASRIHMSSSIKSSCHLPKDPGLVLNFYCKSNQVATLVKIQNTFEFLSNKSWLLEFIRGLSFPLRLRSYKVFSKFQV